MRPHPLARLAALVALAAGQAAAQTPAADIVRRADDLPAPLTAKSPRTHQVRLEAIERDGALSDGQTYRYWTFNGRTPGPFLRVRVGDRIELTLANAADSQMMHNIDLHAVTGPGGGGGVTRVYPGESASFRFKALAPGLYVYHCAEAMAAQHIANGMYGLILVEPEGGLPPVDHEFYVMQGEIYAEADGEGRLIEDLDRLLEERPSHYVMNGAVRGLTGERRMRVRVGDTARLYFGVGGPNKTASLHLIGEIMDRVYPNAALTDAPLHNVQTVSVPPGGATVVEFTFQVPGDYALVDHALTRVDLGALAVIQAEGPSSPEVFDGRDPHGPHSH
ncbi:MAG: nitrite reductase, copper-containing [Brevundimonas sp. 32-68-21]|jgi:nitrite reductase (NO-forming)|uniref:Copper-containing nitrite reductase n=1 Tax=Brevundimonas mediterranea TaxID=74329 RepID=A0AB37EA17_9CAUL|nr:MULTISPECIES: copper-containing nitrite reductase [Brevundimonas]OYX81555.1 MAG: nitrite reductase, copper-containing [Brevundimonas sp. 32-68-21]EDX80914.1 nitrite reductase, copper-containing [Brevundimonas sp. BAL3]MBA4331573.1 nitrite reductase, copper-containing [Brevundimonas sp.]QIH74002.1 nitrite reductase, copper-containing [Brevundimonas mediterranea]TAJ42819.1 MAG: nitrite reductase, copper-containing [Brevundimonas sp.]